MKKTKIILSVFFLVLLTVPFVVDNQNQWISQQIISNAKNNSVNADPTLNLILIWHQHQPVYQDPETGIYEQPWVFMHGVNSYPYMADVLTDYPDINVTVNLTPSLLKQLNDYITGQAWDRRLELYKMDEADMSYENKSIVLQYFFDINSQFRQEGTRYYELSEKANQYTTMQERVAAFTNQELLDLKVLFLANWINPRYTDADDYYPLNQTLENNAAGIGSYSKTDKLNILDYAYTLVEDSLTYHDNLQNAGRMEITTTPFYHPILPLLINLTAGREAGGGNANLALPVNNTGWTEDALAQIEMGKNYTQHHFGDEAMVAQGMWPSEQAVSDEIIPLVNQSGIDWFVTDYTILQNSLGVSQLTDEQWFQPYRVSKDDKSSVVFFRHQALSDAIGFNYGGLQPDTAAQNMIDDLKEIQENWNSSGTAERDPVFTVALDGENAWENYQYDLDGDGDTEYTGNLFREKMYEKLEQAQDAGWLRTTTPEQYLNEHPADTLESLDTLATGSWATDLNVWIGEEDENQAWDRLITARHHLTEYEINNPGANLTDAWESLYAAEGSDWFWWYGVDRDSAHDELFDWAFKTHLRGVYQGIGWTEQEILNAYPELYLKVKPSVPLTFKGKQAPTIDGELTNPEEWDLAGSYNDTANEATDVIGYTYAGVDEVLEDLYIGIKTTAGYPINSLGSDYSINIYFHDADASNTVIFPRYADTTNLSHVLGFELSTAINIPFDGSSVEIYQVNSSKQWEKTGETIASVAMTDLVEMKIPLTAINAEKGDNLLFSFVATDLIQEKNIDVAPQDGPWSATMPIGGVDMTEVFSTADPAYDEHGIYPTNPEMHPDGNTSKTGLMDILRFRIGYDEAEGRVIFEFKFRELYNPWNGPGGYSHPLMQVYIDKDNVPGSGATFCSQNGHFNISNDHAWEIMVRADGWEQWMLYPNETQVTGGMETFSDSVDKIIVYSAPMDVVGMPTQNWSYTVVVGSQDYQAFREFYSQPQEWKFGGGDDSAWDPNIVDMLVPEGMNQEEIINSYSVIDQEYAVLPAVGPQITFEEDTEDPVVTITSPSEDPYTTTDSIVTVEWTATDNEAVTKIELFVGNVFIGEVDPATTSYNFDVEIGDNVIKVIAYDAAENFGSDTITITVETDVSSTSTSSSSSSSEETSQPTITPGFLVFSLLLALPVTIYIVKKRKN